MSPLGLLDFVRMGKEVGMRSLWDREGVKEGHTDKDYESRQSDVRANYRPMARTKREGW